MIAQEMGVDQGTVSRWETHQQTPEIKVQRAVLTLLAQSRTDDSALRRLVENSSDCLHLVEEANHNCLAYSRSRAKATAVKITIVGFILSGIVVLFFFVGLPLPYICIGLFAALGLVQGASFASVPELNTSDEGRTLANGRKGPSLAGKFQHIDKMLHRIWGLLRAHCGSANILLRALTAQELAAL